MKQEEFEIDDKGILFAYHGKGGEVQIPHGVLAIAHHVFNPLEKEITSVTIPDSVIILDEWCFSGCENLKSVHFSEGLEEIQRGAFYQTGLKEVQLPTTLEILGDGAFSNCLSLEKVNIPNSVFSMGKDVFEDTPFFEACLKEQTGEGLVIVGNGILLSYLGEEEETLILPEGIKSIASYVFDESPYHRVELPKTLERIENAAFIRSNLREIRIPKSVTYIGGAAFADCHSLNKVSFEANSKLLEIGDRAFMRCYSLYHLFMEPEMIKSKYGMVQESEEKPEFPKAKLGNAMFLYCTSISEFQLSKHMTEVPPAFFGGCTALTNVTLDENIEKIGESAFSGCTSMRKLTLPSKLKVIEEEAFQSCTSLSHVTIPDSVEEADDTAFRYCHPFLKIEGWTFPEWEDIDE